MDQKAQTTQLLENLRGLRLGHGFSAATPKAQALQQILNWTSSNTKPLKASKDTIDTVRGCVGENICKLHT